MSPMFKTADSNSISCLTSYKNTASKVGLKHLYFLKRDTSKVNKITKIFVYYVTNTA